MSLLLSTCIAEGTLAARPAASIDGRLYVATDAGRLYRDNGVTWDDITPAFIFVEEVIVFTGTSGAFAHAPLRLFGLYRNGIRMTSLAGSPAIATFSATGTAITLSTAAGGSDVFIAVYTY